MKTNSSLCTEKASSSLDRSTRTHLSQTGKHRTDKGHAKCNHQGMLTSPQGKLQQTTTEIQGTEKKTVPDSSPLFCLELATCDPQDFTWLWRMACTPVTCSSSLNCITSVPRPSFPGMRHSNDATTTSGQGQNSTQTGGVQVFCWLLQTPKKMGRLLCQTSSFWTSWTCLLGLLEVYLEMSTIKISTICSSDPIW